MENEKQALKAWRTKGAMGKLHNIGTWIVRTHKDETDLVRRCFKLVASPTRVPYYRL